MVRFPHSLVKLALYNSINRHPVQASPLPSFSIVQPEVLVGHVGGQIVRRLEEIGYGDRFVGILERYGQRDEYLEIRETHHRLTANSNSNFHFVRSNNPPPLLVFISLGSPWHSHLRYSLPETWGIGWGDGGSPRASNSGISSRSNGVSAPDSPSRGYKGRFFFFFFFNW